MEKSSKSYDWQSICFAFLTGVFSILIVIGAMEKWDLHKIIYLLIFELWCILITVLSRIEFVKNQIIEAIKQDQKEEKES